LREAGTWRAFYGERGDRNDEVVFANESNACEQLINEVMRVASSGGAYRGESPSVSALTLP